MVYIMCGGNIRQAFEDLCIPPKEAYRVYTASKDKGYEIWRVSENVVNTFYAVPNDKWDSHRWGWYVYSRKSITMYPIEDITINGREIIAWVNPNVVARNFSSISDYIDTMWNKSGDRAFLDITTNLADLNDMTIEQLVRELNE